MEPPSSRSYRHPSNPSRPSRPRRSRPSPAGPSPRRPDRGDLGLLLVAGGVAVVSAASPEPSASPSTGAPGGTTTPRPTGRRHRRTHSGTKADCPNMGGGTRAAVRRVLDHAEHDPQHGPDAGHLNSRLAVRFGGPPGLRSVRVAAAGRARPRDARSRRVRCSAGRRCGEGSAASPHLAGPLGPARGRWGPGSDPPPRVPRQRRRRRLVRHVGERQRRHRAKHRVRARAPRCRAPPPRCPDRWSAERMVGRHDGRPTATLRDRASIHPVDRRGERQVAGRVAGARPSRTRGGSASGRRAARWRHATRPADGSGRAGPRGPTGRPCPSVRTATCGRCRSSRRRQARPRRRAPCPGAWAPSTSVSMPRRVHLGDELGDGQDQRGRARDVADEEQAGPIGDGGQDRRKSLVGARDREGDRRDNDPCPVARGDGPHRVDRGVVFVIVGQQLVARLEPERLEDRVDAGRRVGYEGEPLGIGAQEATDRCARLREHARQLAARGTAPARIRGDRATPVGPRGPAPDRRRTSRGSGT